MNEPVVIIGGGPAGSAAAVRLALAGREAVMLERSRVAEPRLCGGFLGWDALDRLERLGVDVAALGAAPLERVRLVADDRSVEARLPARAAGLSRTRLDEALRVRADQVGAQVRRGVKVSRIVEAGGGRFLIAGSQGELTASRLLLATGKHDLPGWPRLRPVPDNIGFCQRFRGHLGELRGSVELHLFDGGYAGLAPIEEGLVNLCLIVPAGIFDRAGRCWAGLLHYLERASPQFARRMAMLAPVDDRPQAIAHVPYGHCAKGAEAGLFRIGDQAAVIPSLAGDGIAMALASGEAAAAAIVEGGIGAAEYQRRQAARVRRGMRTATALAHIAGRRQWRAPAMQLAGKLPGLLAAAARWTRADG